MPGMRHADEAETRRLLRVLLVRRRALPAGAGGPRQGRPDDLLPGDQHKGVTPMPNAGCRPPPNFSKRRRLIVTGLTGCLLSHAFETSALSEGLDIPSFEFGRCQFTILHPQRDIPFVRLFGLDGTTVELSTLKGRPILLNFWATWCAPCRTELPILDRLHAQNGRDGLHVLAVCEDRAERPSIARFVENSRNKTSADLPRSQRLRCLFGSRQQKTGSVCAVRNAHHVPDFRLRKGRGIHVGSRRLE